MAEEAASVVFLQVAVFLLDDDVLWSFFVDLLPSASPGLRGAAWLVSPFAGDRETADPAQERPMDADAQRRDDDGDLWCRSSGIGVRRLPAGLGGAPDPRHQAELGQRRATDGARRLRRGQLA
jgi:hypothetical protein